MEIVNYIFWDFMKNPHFYMNLIHATRIKKRIFFEKRKTQQSLK